MVKESDLSVSLSLALFLILLLFYSFCLEASPVFLLPGFYELHFYRNNTCVIRPSKQYPFKLSGAQSSQRHHA